MIGEKLNFRFRARAKPYILREAQNQLLGKPKIEFFERRIKKHTTTTMSTVTLGFVTLALPTVEISHFELPQPIREEVIESKGLGSIENFILSFGRFVQYDRAHHSPIVKYVFTDMIVQEVENVKGKNVLERKDGSTFALKPDSYIDTLSLDDLIFISGICNGLNLKRHCIAVAMFVMEKFGMAFEDLKREAQDDKFRMAIFFK